jgi:hypothetical protein
VAEWQQILKTKISESWCQFFEARVQAKFVLIFDLNLEVYKIFRNFTSD